MRGITYIEIIVVMSIFILFGTCAAPMSFSWYRSTLSRSSRATLLIALRHARAETLAHKCGGDGCSAGASHGVSIRPGRIVLFQGESYAARDETFDEVFDSDAVLATSSASEVVFASSTADVAAPFDLVIVDRDGRSSTTSVGRLGEISQSY